MSRDSLSARWLGPLAPTLWYFFLVWTALAAVVWIGGIREEHFASVANAGLRSALSFSLAIIDPLWFALAACNVHIAVAEAEGIAIARRWVLIVFCGVAVLLACNAQTGFPLGGLLFTRKLGVKLGPVPAAVPLLWYVVLIGARDLVQRCLPRANYVKVALGAGVLAFLTAVVLDPLATKVRLLWFWIDHSTRPPLPAPTPWYNFIVWGVVGAALVFALRGRNVDISAPRSARPPIAFGLLWAVFLAAHVGTLVRG